MCDILLFSCSISPFFNKIPLALLFFFACTSMIYSFWLLGICVLSILLKTCILNMFRICLLGVYVLLILLKLLILNMFRTCLLGIYVLLVLLKLLILNMFCICLWGIYFLWFSLLAPPFPFSLSYFFSHLFVFLLLSACVSIVICLCFFDILLLVRRPAYNVYYGRRTVRTTVVIQCVLRPPYTLQKRTLYALLAHNS